MSWSQTLDPNFSHHKFCPKPVPRPGNCTQYWLMKSLHVTGQELIEDICFYLDSSQSQMVIDKKNKLRRWEVRGSSTSYSLLTLPSFQETTFDWPQGFLGFGFGFVFLFLLLRGECEFQAKTDFLGMILEKLRTATTGSLSISSSHILFSSFSK